MLTAMLLLAVLGLGREGLIPEIARLLPRREVPLPSATAKSDMQLERQRTRLSRAVESGLLHRSA